jgi:phosphoribosylanthranilate isomerase
MRDPINMMEVAALSPDYMGFIFYSKSPRDVGPSFTIPADFPHTIKRVGVFVNDGLDAILQQTKKHSLDYIQLHGVDDSVRFCQEVHDHDVKIIKVFSVDDDFNFEKTEPYKEIADYFLFDTKGKLQGGNGTVFNWRILERYDQKIPFFLSGGLNPGNISDLAALEGMNIHALDINSGVETSPGLKDGAKIKSMQNVLVNRK